ncbi:MAG: TolC family outer membrane protein [Magnetococcales bacterium]|nr:TolC family outer membrane protein [Magnetococcales bacterium]
MSGGKRERMGRPVWGLARCLGGLSCMAIALPCASSWADSLPEAMRSALKDTPRIEAARRSLQAIKERRARAVSGYLPTLDLSLATGNEWSNTTSSRPVEGEVRLQRGEMQVTLNQPLFDGFSTWHQVAENDARESSEQAALEQASEEVALDTVLAYLEVLRQRELHHLLREQEEAHALILDRVRDMARLGLVTSVDADLSESRLKLIISDLASAEGSVRKAATRFRRMVGREPGTLDPPLAPIAFLPKSLQEAIESAMRHNASLQRSKGDLESSRASHAGNYARYWPKVGLDLGYSNTDNVNGVRSYNENVRAMVRMNVNLFHGGADLATVRESAEQLGRSQGLYDETQETVYEEVRTAWERIRTSRERLGKLEDHLESKQRVTGSYHEQFKMGLRPLLDVLNSENELTAAKNALVNEKYEGLSASYRLMAAIGILRASLPGGESDKPVPVPNQEMVQTPRKPEVAASVKPPVEISVHTPIEVATPVRPPVEVEAPVYTPIAVATPVRPPVEVAAPLWPPVEVAEPVHTPVEVKAPVQKNATIIPVTPDLPPAGVMPWGGSGSARPIFASEPVNPQEMLENRGMTTEFDLIKPDLEAGSISPLSTPRPSSSRHDVPTLEEASELLWQESSAFPSADTLTAPGTPR